MTVPSSENDVTTPLDELKNMRTHSDGTLLGGESYPMADGKEGTTIFGDLTKFITIAASLGWSRYTGKCKHKVKNS